MPQTPPEIIPPGFAPGASASLARNWWAMELRGGLAILFGLVAMFLPGLTLASLVLLFGIYAIADGVAAVVAAVRAATHHRRWGALAFEGVAGIGAGVIALAWPVLTLVAFIWLLGAWAIVTGLLMLAAAFRLEYGGWLLGIGGSFSLLWGFVLVIWPLAGAIGVTLWIGLYAVVFGVAMLALGFRLRSAWRGMNAPL